MSNNWSLEGKEIQAIQVNHTDGTSVKVTFPDFSTVFSKETIETLRNNLIEDIDSIDCTEKSKLNKYEIIEGVLEIIDKLFGMKDGKENQCEDGLPV